VNGWGPKKKKKKKKEDTKPSIVRMYRCAANTRKAWFIKKVHRGGALGGGGGGGLGIHAKHQRCPKKRQSGGPIG